MENKYRFLTFFLKFWILLCLIEWEKEANKLKNYGSSIR